MLGKVLEGWRQHGIPPLTLDAGNRNGEPWFLFYGLGVYVPLAPLALVLGPSRAITLAAVAVHALLGFRAGQLAWLGTRSLGVAAATSVLAACAVFPVSDLCARAAVVEFFSLELVGIAILSLGLGWMRR